MVRLCAGDQTESSMCKYRDKNNSVSDMAKLKMMIKTWIANGVLSVVTSPTSTASLKISFGPVTTDHRSLSLSLRVSSHGVLPRIGWHPCCPLR